MAVTTAAAPVAEEEEEEEKQESKEEVEAAAVAVEEVRSPLSAASAALAFSSADYPHPDRAVATESLFTTKKIENVF